MDLSAVLRQGHATYDVRFRGFDCRAREFLLLQQRPCKMQTEEISGSLLTGSGSLRMVKCEEHASRV